MVDKEQLQSTICYHEIQEKDQEALDVLVQREIAQMQRIHSILEDHEHDSVKAQDINYSPANSPKPKVKVPEHRDVVAKWMNEAVLFALEITTLEENSSNKPPPGPRLFTLAASLMDIFLMKCKIKLSQLQLLGSACLSLAAKARKIRLSENALIECSDYAITTEEIQAWEKLVLTKLDWNVNLVIPQDYLDLFCINMNILPTFNDANKLCTTPNEETESTYNDNKNLPMTTTECNKNTANERTKELGNKNLAPSGDNQHPGKTNEEKCSSSSLLSTCTLHPLITKTKTPLEEQTQEDTIEYKKQIAQEEHDNNGGLDAFRTKILHDADLMSSLCSCSYALTSYYPPRMVAMACLLLTARHHCYHLHGNNRSKMSEGSQSISTENVCELLKDLFHFHGDYSSPSAWHEAACLLQRLKLLPCHYSPCHTNEEEKNNQDNNNDELVLISNVMGEIEQFLCTNLPSPTQLSSSSASSEILTVSPPIHSSLSITASISELKKSRNLTELQDNQSMPQLGELIALTSCHPDCVSTDSTNRTTPTPPTSTSPNMPPTETSSPSCNYSDLVATSTPKSRPPLSCKENLSIDTFAVVGTSRRRLHNNSENEYDVEKQIVGIDDKENNDSAIGMNLDITGTSSKGSQYCGSSSQTNSSPSSNGSSKTSSPDSGTSTVSHTKVSVTGVESLKQDFDLNEIRDVLSDCTETASSNR